MNVYSFPSTEEHAYHRIGYAHANKKYCFRHNIEALAAKNMASAERLLAIVDKLARSKNFLADFDRSTIKSLSGIDNCYEIREKNIRVPFVWDNDRIIVLLCYFTKSKHGFDKKQHDIIMRLAKAVNKAEHISFIEDTR